VSGHDPLRDYSFLGVGEAGVIHLSGELDVQQAAALHQVLVRSDDPLVLDMSRVTFVDSSVIRALVRTKNGRPGMQIVNMSPAVDRLMQLTGLTSFFAC
jgi:anti-anti-sigma factor